MLTSSWQKSIRRGDSAEAIRCALALHAVNPEYVFRRIRLIALEEVSVADLSLVAQIIAISGKRVLRAKVGERALLTLLTIRLAASPKCRTPCDLLVWLPSIPDNADSCSGTPEFVASELAEGGECQLRRTAALWKSTAPSSVRTAAGWKVVSRGNTWLRDCWLDATSAPPLVSYIVKRGGSTDCLNSLLVPAWQLSQYESTTLCSPPGPSSALERIAGVPAYAFCLYSEPGRAALANYMARDSVLRSAMACHRVKSPVRALGDVVFNVEGGYCALRQEFRRTRQIATFAWEATLLRHGIGASAASELRSYVTEALPRLNEARREVALRNAASNQLPLEFGA